MTVRDHPLRRRWWLELALGIAVAVLGAWLVLGREERARKPAVVANAGAADAVAEPVILTEPEIPLDGDAWSSRREQVAGEENARPALPAGVATATRAASEHSSEVDDSADTLEVLVLDAYGAPAAGVPVDLELHTEPRSSGPRDPPQPTDANGRVEIPLSTFRRQQEIARFATRFEYRIVVALPLRDRPSLDLGASVPAPGLVILRLPPTGSLLVHVLTEDDLPVEGGATVYLHSSTLHSAPVRDGVAEFPWIDLSLELELRAVLDDRSVRQGEIQLHGPTRQGETVEATLHLGPEWPRIVFRAVDETGSALALARLDLRVTQEPLSPQLAKCWTDQEGRSELQLLGPHRPEYPRQLEIVASAPVHRRALVDLTFELEHGQPTDLGDVVLARVFPR